MLFLSGGSCRPLSWDTFFHARHRLKHRAEESLYLCGAAVKLQHNGGERMVAVTGLRQKAQGKG